MESFLLLAGIALLFLVLNLRRRVHKLEQSLQARQPAQSSTPVGAPPPQPTQPPVTQPLVATTAPLPASESPAFGNLFRWLRDDWLLKLGALLLLIGFGWLARYAFLHGWIGPMGRITLGLVSGALILVLGWWRIQKFLHQGEIFLVLGSTTVLLTLFAARELYGFFTPLSALVVMFLSTAFVAFVSVRYKNRSLALASLILAGVAPLLTNSPAPDYVGLFPYTTQ